MKNEAMEKESHQGLGLKKQKGLRAEMTEGMMDNLSPKPTPEKVPLGLMGFGGGMVVRRGGGEGEKLRI